MTEEKANSQNELLKWILGGVAAGLIGLAGSAQLAFNAFMSRANDEVSYLREDLKGSLGAVAKASTDTSVAQREMTRAIETLLREQQDTRLEAKEQTRLLRQIQEDQQRGVWRASPPPSSPPPESKDRP